MKDFWDTERLGPYSYEFQEFEKDDYADHLLNVYLPLALSLFSFFALMIWGMYEFVL